MRYGRRLRQPIVPKDHNEKARLEPRTAGTSPIDEGALFMTFAGTLCGYPGGLPALAMELSISPSTLRRIRDTAFAAMPRHHLRRLAAATTWNEVPGMRGLDLRQRGARLMRLYQQACRYPECGHSICSQHFIETGKTACIERSSRRAGLQLLTP